MPERPQQALWVPKRSWAAALLEAELPKRGQATAAHMREGEWVYAHVGFLQFAGDVI